MQSSDNTGESMNIFIFPNLSKKNCKLYVKQACEILLSSGCTVYLSGEYKTVFSDIRGVQFKSENSCFKKCDIVVAVGGDGTILKCAVRCAEHHKPVLGINCGRLGFMASLEHTQISDLDRLIKGDYKLSRRMLITASVSGKADTQREFTALNDVVVSKSDSCKIVDFEVSRNSIPISSLRADGVIFSTATGASAYSMSAGGPIIEPEMECIEFTQICPHSLFARTTIFGPDSILKVKCHSANKCMSNVVVDGNKVCKLSGSDVLTLKRSQHYVDIIDINGDNFFKSVNKKLMLPLKELSGGENI